MDVAPKDPPAAKPSALRGVFARLIKARTGPVAWVSYGVVRVAFAIMQIFPLDWNLRTARLVARLWPHLMPRHLARAKEHLRLAYGDSLTEVEISRLADRCLANVAMFFVEAICLPRLVTSNTWARRICLKDFDSALEVIIEGRGAILVTAHYGPFELPAHLLAALGFDVVAVMRPLDNEYLNRFVVRSRKTHGLVLVDKKGATAQAESLLADGYLVSFVGDQDAGRKGLFVDFFGTPASTYKSIGLLAMTTDRPIIVGFSRRLGDRARYEVSVVRVIHPHEWEHQDDPLRWITQEYTTAIENKIRQDPDQYLWIHRRWKSQPKPRRRREASTTPVASS